MNVIIELTQVEAVRLLERLDKSALDHTCYRCNVSPEHKGAYVLSAPVNGFVDLIAIREKLRAALAEVKHG